MQQEWDRDILPEVNLDLDNVELNSLEKKSLLQTVTRLQDLAPTKSFITVKISRTKDLWVSEFTIRTFTVTFESALCNDVFDDLMKNSLQELTEKIKIWKKDRFKKTPNFQSAV